MALPLTKEEHAARKEICLKELPNGVPAKVCNNAKGRKLIGKLAKILPPKSDPPKESTP